MQALNTSTFTSSSNGRSPDSFSNTWMFGLIWTMFWLIPFIVIGLCWHVQIGWNFYHMTIGEARVTAAISYALIALMMVGYLCMVKISRVISLPFVIYFGWTAAAQISFWLFKSTELPILCALFFAIAAGGLGTVKWRILTACAILLVSLYTISQLFYAEIILGQFDFAILPN